MDTGLEVPWIPVIDLFWSKSLKVLLIDSDFLSRPVLCHLVTLQCSRLPPRNSSYPLFTNFSKVKFFLRKLWQGTSRAWKMGTANASLLPCQKYITPVKDLALKDLLMVIVRESLSTLLRRVKSFVFYKHDDDTSKTNLSNYNKDGSPESAHFTCVLLQKKKAWNRQGWSGQNIPLRDGIYICNELYINEWVLIATWTNQCGPLELVASHLLKFLWLTLGSGLKSCGTVCHNIESPLCCDAPGSSVLGDPDPRRTETFVCQTSTSRLPEPTPLTVYRTVSQVPPPLCSSMWLHKCALKNI
jgi:hypothetical protein